MEGPNPAYYDRVARWSQTARYHAEVDALWTALELEPRARVLDVGCGTGAAVRLLRYRGARVTGIDLSTSLAAACRERLVSRADAARLPFADQTFDAVILIHVVAHLGDPGRALAEARRVLRRGGRLGLLTPNLSFLRVVRLVPARSRYVPDPTVERHYTRRAVAELVSGAGLALRSARSWGKLPPLVRLPPFRERLLVTAARP